MSSTTSTPPTGTARRGLIIRLSLIMSAIAAAYGLAACGTDGPAETPAPASVSVSDSTMSAGSSAVAVPGPKPRPASSVAPAEQVVGEKCGVTKGPDGALQIVVTEGSPDCATAKRIADEYGPKIATGEPQTVGGWACAPSATEGELATCTKGDDAFGLAP